MAIARARATLSEQEVRELTGRYNQRLFRIARAIVGQDAAAEDVVQEAWVRALSSLDEFRGDAAFATWLTRILINEAYGWLRRQRPGVDFSAEAEPALRPHILQFPAASSRPDPEAVVANDEMRQALERSIDALPEPFRVIFVARVVEELSVDETAALFGLNPETVKTRLHRARAKLRRALESHVSPARAAAFQFDGARCERLTSAVLQRLGLGS
ncbi:MAG: RNA polymerase sigma factor [Acidobacteria bacterium]|nr:MAG: RNA polymerase sigma factor [Acidobacteriota bacterium]